ncbi:hypothetical protein PG984_009750, partial [Apiospora sp. TS-2023a]
MTGLEIAGIVLGTSPLLVSALEHYKNGQGKLNLLLRGSQLDDLIRKLKIHQKLFYLDVLGLLRDVGIEEVMRYDITEADFVDILQDPKTDILVREYLGSSYESFLEVLQLKESCLKRIAAKTHHIKRVPNADKDDLNAILACKTSGSVSFEGKVSFTMRKSSLVKLGEDLNDERLSIPTIIKAMRAQQKNVQVLKAAQRVNSVANAVERVHQTAASLYTALCSTCTCVCQKHQVLIRLEHRTFLQPQAKLPRGPPGANIFNILIESEGQLREASIGASTETLPSGISNSQEMIGKKELVTDICEITRNATAAHRSLKLELVGTQLLAWSKEDCPEQPGTLTTTSLYDVLMKGVDDKDLQLTLKQRTIFALEAASSVLHLRQTVWLSTGLNCKSIKLLVSSDQARQYGELTGRQIRAICSVYLERTIQQGSKDMLGFVDGPDPKSILRDLAILLLEIWHHIPLEIWAKRMSLEVPNSPESREVTATQWLAETARRVPLFHLNAIEQCFAVCSGKLRIWDDLEFQKLYLANILMPLQKSCSAWDMLHAREKTTTSLGDPDNEIVGLEDPTSQDLAEAQKDEKKTPSTVPSTSHTRSASSKLASTCLGST